MPSSLSALPTTNKANMAMAAPLPVLPLFGRSASGAEGGTVRSLDCDLDLGQVFDPALSLVVSWDPNLPSAEFHPLKRHLVLVPVVEVAEKPHSLSGQEKEQ